MGRTVFVVSNGAIRDTGFLADQIIRADDPVIICTDGAAERMREIGRVPHMIVGDMDSKGRKGDTVSLLPLSSDVRGITLDGFEYPLTGAVMEVGVPYGISNRLTGARGTISVEEGYLLVILTLQSINGVDNFD